MGDDSRLQTLQTIFPDDCDGLSDLSCLMRLDYDFDRLDNDDRYNILLKGCSNGLFGLPSKISAPQVEEKIIQITSCDLCDSALTDAECGESLVKTVQGLPETQRYTIEYELFDFDCKTSVQSCLLTLDSMLSDIIEKEQYQTILNACSGGLLAKQQSNDLTSLNNNEGEKLMCSMCEGQTDITCLGTLGDLFQKVDAQTRMEIESQIFGETCSDAEIESGECLNYLGSKFAALSDEDRLEFLVSACSANLLSLDSPEAPLDIKPISNSNLNSIPFLTNKLIEDEQICYICDSVSNSKCAKVLMDYTRHLDEATRLRLEKDLTGGSCEGIPDSYCLAFLDEVLLSMEQPDLESLLLSGCKSGIFPDDIDPSSINSGPKSETQLDSSNIKVKQYDETNEEESNECTMCGTMSDKECRDYLTDYITELSNILRLTIEKEIFGSDLCSEMVDNECLSYLDSYMYEISDKERLSLLSEACVAGVFDEIESTKTGPSNEQTCDLCDGLDDDECFSTLSSTVQNASPHEQFLIKRTILEERCTKIESGCLTYYDSVIERLSDSELYSLLLSACKTGLFLSILTTTETSLVSVQHSSSSSIMLWGASIFVFAAFGFTFIRRRRKNYFTIPDQSTSEFEIEI